MRRTRASGGEQLGLKRRPLNASDLNKALGINPSSPNPITDRDLAYRYDGIQHRVVSIGGRWKNYHRLARYGAFTYRLEDQYRERRGIKTPTSTRPPQPCHQTQRRRQAVRSKGEGWRRRRASFRLVSRLARASRYAMWITITPKKCAANCSIARKSRRSFLSGALDNPTPFDLGRGLLESTAGSCCRPNYVHP
jgi:hypothetical protein